MTSPVVLVDGFADRMTKLASEMQAANVSCDPNTGAAIVLHDIASDLRRQARQKQIIPSKIDFDAIAAFGGGMQIRAAAGPRRPDLPERITKLFAAARVPLPAAGETVTPATVDVVLREAGVIDIGERMSAKTQFEKHGIVNYGLPSMLAGANRP